MSGEQRTRNRFMSSGSAGTNAPQVWQNERSMPHADHPPSRGPSRHRHRQRRIGRNGCMEPDAARHQRAAPRRRRQIRSIEILDPRPALGRPGTAGARRPSATIFSRHEGTAVSHARGPSLRPDPCVGARREDERLGPCQPALLGDGSQGGTARRLGNPVAGSTTRLATTNGR